MDTKSDPPKSGTVSSDSGEPAPQRDATFSARVRGFARAVRDGDEEMVDELVLRLSGSRRMFAPLALAVGGFAMLFKGLKLLFTNWRLTLVQALPAMWIWLAIYDLKAHLLRGKSLFVLRGPVLIPIVLAIMAITAGSFFLNAIFGFAIVQSGTPKIRPAFAQARSHLAVILGSGAFVGLLLGLSTMVITRSGRPWFGISLSVVIAVMMVCYVAVPSRLIGVKPAASRRDKLTASAISGALGAVVCTPPYVLGRVGILMLGSRALFIPGILIVALAAALQAGATGAVNTVKMSAKLLATDPPKRRDAAVPGKALVPTEAAAPVREQSAPAPSRPDRRYGR
ncbi:MAG: hypothetical protein WBP81_25435 [Solirubrobacteraceae bacterium]